MHKRLLLALAILIVAIQILLPTTTLAQTPPFVFVDDPSSTVPDVPYKIVDADGREYFAFQHTGDNVGNLYFQGPSRTECGYVIYAVTAAVIPDQLTTAQLYNGTCSPRDGSEIADFAALGESDTVNIEAGVAGGGPGTDEPQAPSCASNGGALAWLACPLSELLMNAIGELAHWMSSLLQVSPLETGSQTYIVWESMRNIALALFVIVTLVIIFGQTLGIDAYTIKRTIPRVGAAAIGILLSFYISAFLIDLFNVLGSGMYTLLVGSLGEISIQPTTGSILAEWLAVVGVAGAATLGVISQGAFAFFIMILLPVLLAFLTGFVVIIARQVILLMLVLVSPLAIAAWVLPSTDKWFKRWWNLFTNLLMMYPLIMILLASGTIFAALVSGAENGAGTITEANFINQLIALLALAITVGMIPFTLKASSSLIGRIAGVAGNPNFGPIDRIRKAGQNSADIVRQKKRQDKLAALQSGKNWNDKEVSGEKGAGFRARGRHAWYRLTTGTGPMIGGQYADEHRAEQQRTAQSKEQRMIGYAAQAEDQEYKIEAFNFREEMSKMQAEIPPDEIGERLKQIYLAEDTSDAKRRVVYEVMVNRKDKQLGDIYEAVAKTGVAGGTQLLSKLNQDNFGKVFEFAPQWALSDLSKGAGYQPNWEFAAGAKAGGLSAMKDYSISGTLDHFGKIINDPNSTPEARVEATQKVEDMLRTYSSTRPEERDAKVLRTIRTIVDQNQIPFKISDTETATHPITVSEETKTVVRNSLFSGGGTQAGTQGSTQVSQQTIQAQQQYAPQVQERTTPNPPLYIANAQGRVTGELNVPREVEADIEPDQNNPPPPNTNP